MKLWGVARGGSYEHLGRAAERTDHVRMRMRP